MAKNSNNSNIIAKNRKATHNYSIGSKFEAGIALSGWEVKSLREGRAQLVDSHVIIKKGEAWLLNAHIPPVSTICTHVAVNPIRTRKLLLHKRELNKLIGFTQQKGHALIPLTMYWKKNKVKLELAEATGKKQFDKRSDEKDRDWQRTKEKLFKKNSCY